jgi:sortase (surface protein transpeptidase)
MKFNIRIIAIFIIMAICMQLNTFYYFKNEISNLSDKISGENEKIYERIDEYDEQLAFYYSIIFDLSLEQEVELETEDSSSDDDKTDSNTNSGTSSNSNSNTNSNSSSKDNVSSRYYGRLYVPSANISVALYEGREQRITDRADSANIFEWEHCYGFAIADHKTQEFSKLSKVKVGDSGYIELKNGGIINIECVDVFNGHNTGKYIVDTNGVDAADMAEYLMYTCRDNWRNVLVCLWEKN